MAGHTKFSPDRHFGYAKKALNSKDDIETFLDGLNVIANSAKNQIVKPIRNFENNLPNVHIFDWKAFLTPRYRKAPSRLKVFQAHFFKIKKGSLSIEYRMAHDGAPLFMKLRKQNPNPPIQPQLLNIEELPSTRIEDLKKVEGFISPMKNQDFWKGVL